MQERNTARGGKDSIDHARGAHDDIANAAAGALVLAISGKRKRTAITTSTYGVCERAGGPVAGQRRSPLRTPVKPLRLRVERYREAEALKLKERGGWDARRAR
jgi:hypothetical protein